ncbi:hypothetical protein JCM10207_005246 [Rhodosporidiobolus poonsookiae]
MPGRLARHPSMQDVEWAFQLLHLLTRELLDALVDFLDSPTSTEPVSSTSARQGKGHAQPHSALDSLSPYGRPMLVEASVVAGRDVAFRLSAFCLLLERGANPYLHSRVGKSIDLEWAALADDKRWKAEGGLFRAELDEARRCWDEGRPYDIAPDVKEWIEEELKFLAKTRSTQQLLQEQDMVMSPEPQSAVEKPEQALPDQPSPAKRARVEEEDIMMDYEEPTEVIKVPVELNPEAFDHPPPPPQNKRQCPPPPPPLPPALAKQQSPPRPSAPPSRVGLPRSRLPPPQANLLGAKPQAPSPSLTPVEQQKATVPQASPPRSGRSASRLPPHLLGKTAPAAPPSQLQPGQPGHSASRLPPPKEPVPVAEASASPAKEPPPASAAPAEANERPASAQIPAQASTPSTAAAATTASVSPSKSRLPTSVLAGSPAPVAARQASPVDAPAVAPPKSSRSRLPPQLLRGDGSASLSGGAAQPIGTTTAQAASPAPAPASSPPPSNRKINLFSLRRAVVVDDPVNVRLGSRPPTAAAPPAASAASPPPAAAATAPPAASPTPSSASADTSTTRRTTMSPTTTPAPTRKRRLPSNFRDSAHFRNKRKPLADPAGVQGASRPASTAPAAENSPAPPASDASPAQGAPSGPALAPQSATTPAAAPQETSQSLSTGGNAGQPGQKEPPQPARSGSFTVRSVVAKPSARPLQIPTAGSLPQKPHPSTHATVAQVQPNALTAGALASSIFSGETPAKTGSASRLPSSVRLPPSSSRFPPGNGLPPPTGPKATSQSSTSPRKASTSPTATRTFAAPPASGAGSRTSLSPAVARRRSNSVTMELHRLPPWATKTVVQHWLLNGPSTFDKAKPAELDFLDDLIDLDSFSQPLSGAGVVVTPTPSRIELSQITANGSRLAGVQSLGRVTYPTQEMAERAKRLFDGKRMAACETTAPTIMWVGTQAQIDQWRASVEAKSG